MDVLLSDVCFCDAFWVNPPAVADAAHWGAVFYRKLVLRLS